MDSAHIARTQRVEYYVRDINASSPTTEEVLAVVMAINSAPLTHVNVRLPAGENILTPEQYQRLPEPIRRLFVHRVRELDSIHFQG